jgi:hypothetical protein
VLIQECAAKTSVSRAWSQVHADVPCRESLDLRIHAYAVPVVYLSTYLAGAAGPRNAALANSLHALWRLLRRGVRYVKLL